METFNVVSWVTDPYHPENQARNEELVKFLEGRSSRPAVITPLDLGVYRFTTYPELTSEEQASVQRQVEALNYEPLTIAVDPTEPLELTSYQLFLSRLVEQVTGVRTTTITVVSYEDHIDLTPITPLLVPLYIRPSELGDYVLRLSPTPFRGGTFLADTPLIWLALSDFDESVLRNYTFWEKEGVIAYKSSDPLLDRMFLRQLRKRLEDYRARNVRWHHDDLYHMENRALLEEWAKLWRVPILARYPHYSPYIFYEAPISPHFSWNYGDVLADLRQNQLPTIAITGDWVQSERSPEQIREAAVPALTELVASNPVLALSLPGLRVLPDLTILVRLGALVEAEAFYQRFRDYLAHGVPAGLAQAPLPAARMPVAVADARIEISSMGPNHVVMAMFPEAHGEFLFDIMTEDLDRLRRVTEQRWLTGFFLSNWGQTYYLYEHQYSQDLIRSDPVLAAAGTSLEAGAEALDYLQGL